MPTETPTDPISGPELRELRLQAGVSTAELGRAFDPPVTRQAISRAEVQQAVGVVRARRFVDALARAKAGDQ